MALVEGPTIGLTDPVVVLGQFSPAECGTEFVLGN